MGGSTIPLTLFNQGGWGGGQKVPELTLKVNNLFNIEANATKLSYFSQKQFCMTSLGPINLAFPWQQYFDRHGFRNFDFLAFLIRISRFLCNFHIFRSFYRLFNGSCYFLINFDGFGGFWRNLKI